MAPRARRVTLTSSRTDRQRTSSGSLEPYPGWLQGYRDWAVDMITVELGPGVPARVAALDDVIASNRASGRPKDEWALPYLESLRNEVRDRGDT